jgi:hypothetical protein
MFIKNIDKMDQDKLFRCNSFIANWLIYKKHISLMGRNDDVWYFAKTKELEEALKDKNIILSIVGWL